MELLLDEYNEKLSDIRKKMRDLQEEKDDVLRRTSILMSDLEIYHNKVVSTEMAITALRDILNS